MKKILLSFLMFVSFYSASAQISLMLYNFRPTGEFGYVMKPAYSAELGYANGIDEADPIRSSFSITYLSFTPRLDTFPTTGYYYSGSTGSMVVQGYQCYQKYNLLLLYCGMDWPFIKKDPFFVYVGLDITAGFSEIEYTSYMELISDESYSGGSILAGFRGRLGVEYKLSKSLGLFANLERMGWLNAEPKSTNAGNTYGIGIHLNFN
ncbi:MAG TPA: hypothetical protein PKL85_10585 [Bacteroidia bacterium]|nr:hypothetical protein [Bacteroidia bacterium]